MRRLSIWCRIYLGLALFSILGSLLTKATGLDPGPIKPLAAALTLLIGAVAIFEPIVTEMGTKKGLLCFAAVFAIGAAAEIVGIYTGFPFGRYEYTNQWWPTITLPGGHHYPLLLPFAWAMIVGGAFFRSLIGDKATLAAVLTLGPIWATLIDFLTEKIMVNDLHYWRWLEPTKAAGAPIQNYIGWLLTSAAAIGALWTLGARPTKRYEPLIVIYTHIFMVVLIATIA